MDVGTIRDGFEWHRPMGEIGRWKFARRAGVHAHPLRRRVGTQPAATHPLVNREIAYSLRGDLGRGCVSPVLSVRAGADPIPDNDRDGDTAAFHGGALGAAVLCGAWHRGVSDSERDPAGDDASRVGLWVGADTIHLHGGEAPCTAPVFWKTVRP